MTLVSEIYESFFSYITDDMYMEITEEETHKDCKTLLRSSISLFEFPPFVLKIVDAVDIDGNDISYINGDLTLEEINILAVGMVQLWLQRQMTSIEVIRQKFTGTDFKMTSQASHLQRLIALITNTKDEHRRLQMLHSRREVKNGKYETTFWKFVH